MEKKYDIVVIGAGPGGVAAAKKAIELGATVALIEKDKIGGTCLHRGCIPTKSLIHKALAFKEARKILKFNDTESFIFDEKFMNARIKPNWSALLEDAQKIIALNQKGLESSIKQAGIEAFHGEAEVLPNRQVKVVGDEEQVLSYNKGVIVATGSSPKRFEQFNDLEGDVVFYSDDIFDIEKFKELPKKLLIVGGGVIGCEFASIFNNLGVEVTIVEALPQILFGILDPDFAKNTIMREFKKKKINVITDAEVKTIEKTDSGNVIVGLIIDSNKGVKGIVEETEKVLIVAGRVPNDEMIQNLKKTTPDCVYCVGDAFGKNGLAYTAEQEGEGVAFLIMTPSYTDYCERYKKSSLVPLVIFSDPEIATVGFIEGQFNNGPYRVAKYMYRGLGKSHCDGEICGEVKMIINSDTKEVVGVQICGANATEIIQTAYVLMYNKIPYNKWLDMLWPHPTYGEVFKEALKTLKE